MRSGGPDFIGLYGSDEYLTPSAAGILWATAGLLRDLFADDRELLLAELPPVARRLSTDVWLRRFLDCFTALADRISIGGFELHELTRCTEEEMAVHIVIDNAARFVTDGVFSEAHWGDVLPRASHKPPDWEFLHEILFRDDDVLLLFDPANDGIEDPSSELHQRWRLANLHPDAWFLPFGD